MYRQVPYCVSTTSQESSGQIESTLPTAMVDSDVPELVRVEDDYYMPTIIVEQTVWESMDELMMFGGTH